MSRTISQHTIIPSKLTKLCIAIGCIEDYIMFGDGDLSKALELLRQVCVDIEKESDDQL